MRYVNVIYDMYMYYIFTFHVVEYSGEKMSFSKRLLNIAIVCFVPISGNWKHVNVLWAKRYVQNGCWKQDLVEHSYLFTEGYLRNMVTMERHT
jgi:hypothetical protein